ncbi:M56 family metallopeptidase [Oleiagrimonas soli]|nr:M56 family metallopeptidase [Oleiagrimonas soli]
MATLAVTAGLCLVGLMRRPWRRAFGAEQACRLWWLPLLALAASQIPHIARGTQAWPIWLSMRWDAVPAAATSTARLSFDAATVWLVVWLLGWALVLLYETVRQYRFARRVRRVGQPTQSYAGLPVVRLSGSAEGPALFGCWRPKILVPADFERCYDTDERTLILAHERMHARRGDLPCLLIGVVLRAAFWFNPMSWWALRCLRQDQELACDAAMLRREGTRPRRYADVLLKAQFSSTLPAPMGCAWQTHPVKERITMLKKHRPTVVRRISGVLSAALLAGVLVTAVYANTAIPGEPTVSAHGTATGPEYQLSIAMQVESHHGKDVHAQSADMALCMRAAQYGQVMLGDVVLNTHLHVLSDDRVAVDVKVNKGAYAPDTKQLTGAFGHVMHTEFLGQGDAAAAERRVRLDVTPIRGCPARNTVSTKMRDKSVRDAAETIAATAGLILDNPQALSVREVSFHFKDMDPVKAMHLLAQVDGKRAVFDGKHVRFEAQ